MTRADFFATTVAAAATASPLPLPTALPTGSPSLAVYHVRDIVTNGTPIAPAQLLSYKGVRIVELTGAADISAANAAVDAARPFAHESAAPLDVRWGLRFATATGRFVHGVYCDATAATGEIDGRPVAFANGPELLAYLTRSFDSG